LTESQELRTFFGTIIVLLVALVVTSAGILRRQLGSEEWQRQREKPIDAMGAWIAAHSRKRRRLTPEETPEAVH
jgi:hypothetical protein